MNQFKKALRRCKKSETQPSQSEQNQELKYWRNKQDLVECQEQQDLIPPEKIEENEFLNEFVPKFLKNKEQFQQENQPYYEYDSQESYDGEYEADSKGNLDFNQDYLNSGDQAYADKDKAKLKEFEATFQNEVSSMLVPKHQGEVGEILDKQIYLSFQKDIARYQKQLVLKFGITDPTFHFEEYTDPQLVQSILTLYVGNMGVTSKEKLDALLHRESQECKKFMKQATQRFEEWENQKFEDQSQLPGSEVRDINLNDLLG